MAVAKVTLRRLSYSTHTHFIRSIAHSLLARDASVDTTNNTNSEGVRQSEPWSPVLPARPSRRVHLARHSPILYYLDLAPLLLDRRNIRIQSQWTGDSYVEHYNILLLTAQPHSRTTDVVRKGQSSQWNLNSPVPVHCPRAPVD